MYTGQEHEEKLNSLIKFLSVEGIDQGQVSLLIQELRDNYTDVNTKFTESQNSITKFTELNEGLRNANMSLISKLGTSITDITAQKQQQQTQTQQAEEDTLSLDDITKNFL